MQLALQHVAPEAAARYVQQSRGRRERGGDYRESEKLLPRRGEKPVDEDGEHRVRVGDSAAEHDAREGAREVCAADDHRKREHRKRRGLARLLLAAQREMALDELRLRPDADRRDDCEEDYVKPARAARKREESVVRALRRRERRKPAQPLRGAADRVEERDEQRAYADDHDEPLQSLGVKHAAQPAPDDRKADHSDEQSERRVHRNRDDARDHHRRALKDRRAVDDQQDDGNRAYKGLEERSLVSLREKLRRRARVELPLPQPRRPREVSVDEPRSEPDVAGRDEQHLKAEKVAEPAEADERDRRDIRGDIGERLHRDADLAGQQRVVAARVLRDKDEYKSVAGPEQHEGGHLTSPS